MPVHHLRRAVHVSAAVAVCLLVAKKTAASDVMGPMPPPAHRQFAPVPPPAVVTGMAQHHRPPSCPDCCGDCRGGTCPALCPVRPDEFGFYETRWRTWPGVAAARPVDIEAVTPVSPPRSEVPPVDEESRAIPLPESLPADVAPLPAPQPVPDRSRAREPSEPEAPAPEGPAKEPQGEQPAEPVPAPRQEPVPPTKQEKPTEEENLFDEASRRLPRAELMALLMKRAAQRPAAPVSAVEPVVPVAHTSPIAADAAPQSNALRGSREGRSRNPLR